VAAFVFAGGGGMSNLNHQSNQSIIKKHHPRENIKIKR
jgi:hypothetical protein